MVFGVIRPTDAFLYHDQHQGGTFMMLAIYRADRTDERGCAAATNGLCCKMKTKRNDFDCLPAMHVKWMNLKSSAEKKPKKKFFARLNVTKCEIATELPLYIREITAFIRLEYMFCNGSQN